MDDKSQRDKKIQRVILIEGSANLIVLIAKTIVGFSTGSLAILADAIHSLTDVANNIVAWIIIRLSSLPADREHPYGHKKFETLAVFGLASLLTVLAFELAINAFNKEAEEIITGDWEFGVMIAVLCINISLASWQRNWARRLKSDILLADASHTFADVLTTIVVILGWQLSAMGYPVLDKICALGVSGLIIYLAYHLFKRAIPILVDEFAIDPELLNQTVKAVPGVLQVKRVRSRWMGNIRAVDMIITVDPSLSTEDAHKITDDIEIAIEKRFNVLDTSIHVEPEK